LLPNVYNYSQDLTIVSIMGTNEPIMGTEECNDSILSGLFGKTRRAILSLLFMHPDERFYLRQILRLANVAPGAGQRELAKLTNSGLLKRSVEGNQVYFQAAADCPIFDELKRLIIKTAGLGDILSTALASLGGGVRTALLYGSAAKGGLRSHSDIDVLVVGEASFADVAAKLSPLQNILHREINPIVLTMVELKTRISQKDHFILAILDADFTVLLGEIREFERLVEKRLAD
jgi:predicted nucleotidyltransferase